MDKRCSFCISKNFEECLSSPNDSSRCSQCVRLNRPYCDVRGLSNDQLQKVSTEHFRLEEELETAEDALAEMAAKVSRLRKQKKIWYDRMRRAVARGITDLEELDRVEREEAEAARQAATAQSAEGSSGGDPASSLVDGDLLEPWALDPELARSLGFDGVFPQAPLHSQDSR
jgi:hypothetical protein